MEQQRVGPAQPGVSEVEIDGLACVFSPTTQQVMVLNQSASDIWLLADGEHTVSELVALLARAYSLPVASVDVDVRATIASFCAAGLIPPTDIR